jgi:hypothetical protein
MSTSSLHRTLAAIILAAAVLVVVDWAFGAFSRRHFIPAQKLEAALSSGPVDALFAGDSRMVAALDVDAVQGGWSECAARTPAIADLSLGAVEIAGQAVAVRTFFERGGSAKLVVLGTVPESLTSESAAPDAWIGNEAVVLWWSHASDARLHFPLASTAIDPRTLDGVFRFLAYRVSSLASLRSVLWAKVQHAQDAALAREVVVAKTAFGQESDMRALGQRFVEQGFRVVESDIYAWRLSAWACDLRREVETHGARLVVVELPMPTAYRGVRASPLGQALRKNLSVDFCGRSVDWLDLSNAPGLTEERFSDGLHLDRVGAALVSRPLGCRVSSLLDSTESGCCR